MNNEPVAWTNDRELTRENPTKLMFRDKGVAAPIPLYTHPVKEQDTDCQYCKQGCIRCDARKQLTDEEIMDELVKVKHTWVATTSVWYEFEKEELKKAIRAILRKAQNG